MYYVDGPHRTLELPEIIYMYILYIMTRNDWAKPMWAIVLNDLNSSRFIFHEYLSYHVLCHVIMLQYVEGEHHYGEGHLSSSRNGG